MPRTRMIPAAALLATLALTGCAQTDPYQREGIWKPSGVNDANLAAQIANPADLTRGRGDGNGSVRTSTTAVDRMWQGGPARGGSQAQGGGQQAPSAGAGATR